MAANKFKFEIAKNKLKRILAGGVLVVGMNAASMSSASAVNAGVSVKKENVDKKNSNESKKLSLTKKYKITDRTSFDKLWKDARPFCIPVLALSENWRPDWHDDKQQNSAPNSVGVGLFHFPVNGNFKSANWGSTGSYYRKYKNKHKISPAQLTPKQIRDGVYGYGESYKNGQVITDLYLALKGCELTINEFAAIYSHYYHVGNKTAVNQIAKTLKGSATKDKPLKCAQILIDADPIVVEGTRYNGRKTRFMHEALVFLNEDNYCNDLFWLKVDCKVGTSINACPEKFNTVRNGGLTHKKAKEIKTAICNCQIKNGKTIKSLCESVKDKEITAFCVATPNAQKMNQRNETYNKAIDAYNKGDYKKAKQLFEDVIAQNGEGADLWNDLAITYLNLEEYTKCIEMCRKVLATGQKDEYAKACYNAGKAYEAKKEYKSALKNYKNAEVYYEKYGIADKDNNVNYIKIYKNAISRVEKQINQTDVKTKKTSGKSAVSKQKNTNNKAAKFKNAKMPNKKQNVSQKRPVNRGRSR